MKFIKISNLNIFAIVDDEDYDRVSKHTWDGSSRSKTLYKYMEFGPTDTISMASFIINDRLMYDHKDRNPLNNQKENLRPCSYAENAWNRKKATGNFKSKFKGVDFRKLTNRWRARITANNKRITIGEFEYEVDAAIAYNKYATNLHKNFAVLNII